MPGAGNLLVDLVKPSEFNDPPAGNEFVFAVDIALTDDGDTLSPTTPATVCLPTTDVPLDREPVLYHYVASASSPSPAWTDISSDSDSTRPGDFVCGETPTFSPFAVGSVIASTSTGDDTTRLDANTRLNEQILSRVSQAGYGGYAGGNCRTGLNLPPVVARRRRFSSAVSRPCAGC